MEKYLNNLDLIPIDFKCQCYKYIGNNMNAINMMLNDPEFNKCIRLIYKRYYSDLVEICTIIPMHIERSSLGCFIFFYEYATVFVDSFEMYIIQPTWNETDRFGTEDYYEESKPKRDMTFKRVKPDKTRRLIINKRKTK